jgi:hypothetical protein
MRKIMLTMLDMASDNDLPVQERIAAARAAADIARVPSSERPA